MSRESIAQHPVDCLAGKRAQNAALHRVIQRVTNPAVSPHLLLPTFQSTLIVAYVVIGIELPIIAFIRNRYFSTSVVMSVPQVVLGGSLVLASGDLIGAC